MAKDWKVTAQTQTMMLTSGGQWVEGMKVEFTTTEGITGSITVPLSQYNASGVAELLDARVAQLNEVASL